MRPVPWNLDHLEVTTVAAIDCGTNSIRLLILRRESGQVRELCREMIIVRLGEGVAETGLLSEAAIKRTVEAAQYYAELCVHYGVQRLDFVATSAARDAENSGVFTEAIEEVLGVQPRVLTGAEEAQFSFAGAVASLLHDSEGGAEGVGRGFSWPALVVDIGGGSTEFVLGAVDSGGQFDVAAVFSANMGSVRLTEMFPGFVSADSSEIKLAAERAAAWVDSYLDEVAEIVDFTLVRSVIGVAGTVTTVTAKALGLTFYQAERIHGVSVGFSAQLAACRYFVEASLVEKQGLAYMPEGRADVIAAGAVIWERILSRLGKQASGVSEVIVSEHDILDGVAAALLF